MRRDEVAVSRHLVPFVVAATAGILVCLVVIALPESLVVSWRRNRSLTGSQAGWAYGLLCAAAAAQVLYSGYVAFSPAKVRDRAGGEQADDIAASVARNAAFVTLLTLVYGLAAMRITGERGGFWVFPLLAVAQGAWLARDARLVRETLAHRTSATESDDNDSWTEPDDFVPPLARGLSRRDGS